MTKLTGESVGVTVSDIEALRTDLSSSGRSVTGPFHRIRDDHRLEIYPQLADVLTALAVGVGAGVPVRTGGEAGYRGVGGVGVSPATTGQREHAAHSEARGAGTRGGSSQGATLRGRVASSVQVVGTSTWIVGEADHVKDPLARYREEY